MQANAITSLPAARLRGAKLNWRADAAVQHRPCICKRRIAAAPSKPPPLTAPRLSKSVGVACQPDSQLAGIHRSPASCCLCAAGC